MRRARPPLRVAGTHHPTHPTTTPMRTLLRRALCSALALYGPLVFAQSPPHFDSCATQTGGNASVIFPSSALITLALEADVPEPIEVGDEIAVFTPEGLCAGTLTWLDDATALAVWEDDPETPDKDGFTPGDPIAFHLWHLATGQEIGTAVAEYDPLFEDSDTFTPDAVYVVTALAFAEGAVSDGDDEPALAFSFEPNYPNPFTDRTTLGYALPEAAHVRLDVYDIRGRRVATLVNDDVGPGRHEVRLDAAGLASGTYVARLTAGTHVETQRLQLVR